MWICPHCRVQNQDTDNACVSCGAARAQGRFGSSSMTGNTRKNMPPPPAARQAYPLPDTGVKPRRPRPRKAETAARFAGTALLTLLPVLTALVLWRQYGAWRQPLAGLLLPGGAAGWQQLIVYLVFSLAAVLLSLLPGLWTLLLVRDTKNRDD